MKNILLSLLLLISATSFAQTISLDSITVGGIKFRAEADFECMTWNKRTKSVALQWKIKVFGYDSSVIKEKDLEQIADDNGYVYQDGTPVIHTDSVYLDSTVMMYKYANEMVIPEYKFYETIAEHGANGATIYDLIRAAGLRRKGMFVL